MGLGDQRLRGLGVVVDLGLREPQGHADRDQPRLDAVVQVAFDARALDLGGTDGTGSTGVGRPGLLDQLRLAGRDEDRPHDDAVQDRETDDHAERDDDRGESGQWSGDPGERHDAEEARVGPAEDRARR